MKQRVLNFEVLRILAMFLIVIWHFLVKGTIHYGGGHEIGYLHDASIYNLVLYSIFTVISSCGVDLFVLISGYFLSTSFVLKFSRVFHIWVITFFYLFFISVFCLIFYQDEFSCMSLLKDMRPIMGSNYWFIKSYFAMVLLAPFIATTLKNISKKATLFLILILFFLGSHYTGDYFDTNNNLRLFALMFVVAGYIKKYDVPKWLCKNVWYILFLIWTIQIIFSLINIYSETSSTGFRGYAVENNSVTIFTSILLFIGFKRMNITKSRKLLESLSQYVFAIYLIHDNNHIADLLWNRWLHISTSSPLYPLQLFLIPVIIYLLCVCVDMIRYKLFIFLGIYKLENKIKGFDVNVEK